MVSGFPGFFILGACPGGCIPPIDVCPVCDGVGQGVCVVHSNAPYIIPTIRKNMIAVHRDLSRGHTSIRTVCGDVIIYLDTRYGI